MPDPQSVDPQDSPFVIGTGFIKVDYIEAGTIPDPDGSLAAMTDQLIADLRAANTGALRDPVAPGPIDRTDMEELGRALLSSNLRKEFDARHPVLCAFKGWPVLGSAYHRALSRFSRSREI